MDCTLAELAERKDGDWVTVGGMIAECKRIRTKKGDPMMFATLDDLEGQVEILVFNSAVLALFVHSGDLFDGLRPAYTELDRGVSALQELAAIAPVVAVAGNHDSPALFRLFDRLLGPDAPIRFVDRARRPEAGGVLEFPGEGDEIVRLAPLPFVHANRLVEQFEEPETWMAQYADRKQATVVKGLGLRRIRQTVELKDTPAIRGMIHKVRHLVTVAE